MIAGRVLLADDELTFLEATSDLLRAEGHECETAPDAPTGTHACQLLACPRGAQLATAVRETIGVLEETKQRFKSKQLGAHRERLGLLLEHV